MCRKSDLAKLGEILTEISFMNANWVGRAHAVVLYGQGEEVHPAFFRLARELGLNRSGDDWSFHRRTSTGPRILEQCPAIKAKH